MSAYKVFNAKGSTVHYSHHTPPPSSMLFVYYCRHVPTGKVTREQAYFEDRAVFDACMQRWNTAHPAFWRFSEREEFSPEGGEGNESST